MPDWDDYKNLARDRGSLAFELYVIKTRPLGTSEEIKQMLPAHLTYQQALASEGKIFIAGPTSDSTGSHMQGFGMIIYRASSLEEAKEWADGDPMHSQNLKSYSLSKWLVNECAPTLIKEIERLRDNSAV
mgnify:CR=1 FL=1